MCGHSHVIQSTACMCVAVVSGGECTDPLHHHYHHQSYSEWHPWTRLCLQNHRLGCARVLRLEGCGTEEHKGKEKLKERNRGRKAGGKKPNGDQDGAANNARHQHFLQICSVLPAPYWPVHPEQYCFNILQLTGALGRWITQLQQFHH